MLWAALSMINPVCLPLAAQMPASSPAQTAPKDYHFPEYPETRGQPEVFHTRSLPTWLQFDGELRGRLEGQSAINDRAGESAAYLLTRIRGGVRVIPNPHADLYLQFHDTHALGLPRAQVSSNMRDNFDLRQGYLALHAHGVRFIGGRQELKFGSERLVGISDFTNNARSFDGFDLRVGGANHIDFFTSSVVVVQPTSLDKHGAGLTFHGAYATLNRVVPGFSLQPFLFAATAHAVKDPAGETGSKAEFTFGGEASGRVVHRFDTSGMLAIQRGRYASQSISAEAGFFKVGYILPRVVWESRVGIEYDRATGDDHSQPGTRRVFDQQYPSNHDAFGLVDLFGFQNITQKRINLDIAPSSPLSVLIQAGSLHLATVNDAIYASAGSSLRPATAGGFPDTKLGYEADFSAKYLISDDLVINAGYGHFFSTSSNVKSAGNGYLSFTYRFSVVSTKGK